MKNNPDNQSGMSMIDLLILLILIALTIAGVVWASHQVEDTSTMVNFFLIFIGSRILYWLVWERRKEKLDLKKDFENGLIDEDHYRWQVGERFFRKHHGE